MNKKQQAELLSFMETYCKNDGNTDTSIPALHFYRMKEPTGTIPAIYTPCFSLVVQGKKQALLKNEIYRYSESEFLITAVDMPVCGQVTEASPEHPYFCIQIDLDMAMIGDLIVQLGWKNLNDNDAERGLFIGNVNEEWADCIVRLLRLLRKPNDVQFLGPCILREMHYRLLSGEYGRRVAQVVFNDTTMQRIAQVIVMLKKNFSKQIRIENMAEQAHMSVSTFHNNFKKVTGLSPLQYQKQLRLLEARRIMFAYGEDAASTAYAVGYESPSQFSREYSRMFGAPPMADIAALQENQPVISELIATPKIGI